MLNVAQLFNGPQFLAEDFDIGQKFFLIGRIHPMIPLNKPQRAQSSRRRNQNAAFSVISVASAAIGFRFLNRHDTIRQYLEATRRSKATGVSFSNAWAEPNARRRSQPA